MSFSAITYYGARRARKSLREMVARELTDRPTLLAVVNDFYTQEQHIRPFFPLAERFHNRMNVILCAEWPQPERERDGELLLESLSVARDVRPRLLRDEGEVRCALVLRQKQPIALIDLYFKERAKPGALAWDDGREQLFLAREEVAAQELERLLVRLPAQPPTAPPPPPLKAGEHDFNSGGVCLRCGDGRMSLRACPKSQPVDEGPARDRFELIELE